jgi:hypothetical protein
MATKELFAQAILLQSEDRRVLAELLWETVDADLPAQWNDEVTLATEVERRFAAFQGGTERGLSHDEVFASARALI